MSELLTADLPTPDRINNTDHLRPEAATNLWLSGKDRWNEWVKRYPNARISFRGVDFGILRNEYQLDCISFNGFHFTNGYVDFSDTVFEGDVDFSDIRIERGKFMFRNARFCGKKIAFALSTTPSFNVIYDLAWDFSEATFTNSTVQFFHCVYKRGVTFDHAQFFQSSLFLHSATFLDRVSFFKADLATCLVNLSHSQFDKGMDFRVKNSPAALVLNYTSCPQSDFSEVDMCSTALVGANLRGSNFAGVTFNHRIRCRGVNVDGCWGSPSFKRFLEHQDYIEEFKSHRRNLPVYYLWLVMSDCGRSIGLWLLWSLIFAVSFAGIFYGIGIEQFHTSTPLAQNTHPFFALLYYSVVTFTTLGFGDITPLTFGAAFAVMAEVLVGYIMLGGLISIFSNKLVER